MTWKPRGKHGAEFSSDGRYSVNPVTYGWEAWQRIPVFVILGDLYLSKEAAKQACAAQVLP